MCENRELLWHGQEFLFLLRNSSVGILDTSTVISVEIIHGNPSVGNQNWTAKPRKRGRHGGVRQQLRRMGHHQIPLPTIILTNVQSLHSKIDEPQANVKFLMEYKNCLLAFTETWLKNHDLQSDLEIEGFKYPFRCSSDR